MHPFPPKTNASSGRQATVSPVTVRPSDNENVIGGCTNSTSTPSVSVSVSCPS